MKRRTWRAEAGAYDVRVIVQKRSENTVTELNEPVESWQTFCTRWASIQGSSGREYVAAEQSKADTTHKVRMRADSKTREITPKMRLVSGSRVFEITSAIDVESRHVEMMLDCREVVA